MPATTIEARRRKVLDIAMVIAQCVVTREDEALIGDEGGEISRGRTGDFTGITVWYRRAISVNESFVFLVLPVL